MNYHSSVQLMTFAANQSECLLFCGDSDMSYGAFAGNGTCYCNHNVTETITEPLSSCENSNDETFIYIYETGKI